MKGFLENDARDPRSVKEEQMLCERKRCTGEIFIYPSCIWRLKLSSKFRRVTT